MYPTREAVSSIAQQRRAQLMREADSHRLARAAHAATLGTTVGMTTTVIGYHPQPRAHQIASDSSAACASSSSAENSSRHSRPDADNHVVA